MFENLKITADKIFSSYKGILAADESNATMGKRLQALGLENKELNRRSYREMLLTTPNLNKYIGGVILYDETFRQNSISKPDLTFSELLKEEGIEPGIKTDKGLVPLPISDDTNELITQGLDGLKARLEEYKDLGAGFTKWRSFISLSQSNAGNPMPREYVMDINANILALQAAFAQEQGLIPIIEPEISMMGEHSMEDCALVTERMLNILFEKLDLQGVFYPGAILKINMCINGKSSKAHASHCEVAKSTLDSLRKVVPPTLNSIVFLSGGQSELDSTIHLDLINKINNGSAPSDLESTEEKKPWAISFSYGRALQESALKIWSQDTQNENNIKEAQSSLLHRCKMNWLANQGNYNQEQEKESH